MVNHRSFQIGTATVDPMRCIVFNGQEERRVEPQVMGVLIRLIDEPGEVVTRDQLLQSAWPDTVVNDGALSKAVSVLRKVLGDNARQPQFIETIPKVGYRILAPVQYLDMAGAKDNLPSLPYSIHVNASDERIKRNTTNSFLRLKLRELTVAQFLVLLSIVGLVFMLWPRPAMMELEEEITLITMDGEEIVRTDTTWRTVKPYSRISSASVDTLVFKEINVE